MAKNDNVIGKVIRKYRNYHNLSRVELADKLHVSAGTIEAYEYGKAVPPIERLKKLHKILDIPITEFFADLEQTKGYIAKLDEKLIKAGIAEVIENPEMVEHIKNLIKNYDSKTLKLFDKILKIPKNKRKLKYSLISKLLSMD